MSIAINRWAAAINSNLLAIANLDWLDLASQSVVEVKLSAPSALHMRRLCTIEAPVLVRSRS